MRSLRHSVCSCPLLALLFAGCTVSAGVSGGIIRAPTPSRPLTAELGNILVVPGDILPDPEFQTRPKDKLEAGLIGAGAGLGIGVAGGALCFTGLPVLAGRDGPFLWVLSCLAGAATPGLIVYGAAEGAVKGVPLATVGRVEATLKKALADPAIRDGFRRHLAQTARHQALNRLAPPTEPIGAEQNIDTIFEIRVTTLGLKSMEAKPDFYDPLVALSVTVRTRLISVRDATRLHAREFEYPGGAARKFTEWANEEENLFREELDRAYRSLASTIVQDLSSPQLH